MKVTRIRSNNLAKAGITRISYEYDLQLDAAKPKNHDICNNAFLRPTTSNKVGRPEGDSVNLTKKNKFAYIENNDNDSVLIVRIKRYNILNKRDMKIKKTLYKPITIENTDRCSFN